MENRDQHNTLLIKYLTDDLDPAERAHVENWLLVESNRKYFDELKEVFKIAQTSYSAQQIDPEKEWLEFKLAVKAKSEDRVSENNEKRESPGIEPVLKVKSRRSVLRRLSVATGVAASVLLIIGLGWKFFYTGGKGGGAPLQLDKDTNTVFVAHREKNTTGKDVNVNMSDGSVVVLANNSEIRYVEPFVNKRTINLTGKAFFKVAKGKAIPFIVGSGCITTTAIGTEFTVTAFDHADLMSVRLYEGKVVVKPVNKADPRMKADVYMLPGQELLYDYKKGVTVRNFRSETAKLKETDKAPSVIDKLDAPTGTSGSWYMFNNQSLAQVLKSLSALYNVKIIYNEKDIKNIYFTGKYDKTESLDIILNRIATINELKITKDSAAFIITK